MQSNSDDITPREFIGEYLRNHLVIQVIIDNEGLSGRKRSREPKVRVSKIFNPKEMRDQCPRLKVRRKSS